MSKRAKLVFWPNMDGLPAAPAGDPRGWLRRRAAHAPSDEGAPWEDRGEPWGDEPTAAEPWDPTAEPDEPEGWDRLTR